MARLVCDWNELRHHRRYFLYPIIAFALLFSSLVSIQTGDLPDQLLDFGGILAAFCGQAIRLWAWAANSAGPGLRIHGPYGFVRHPLYVGNFLIALGLLMIFNAPIAYLVVLPSLALLYWSVSAQEEDRMEKKLGAAYAEYRAKVPRFLPWRGLVLKGQQPGAFNWRQALATFRCKNHF